MSQNNKFRLNVLIHWDTDPDVCEFLDSKRSHDRRAIVCHALRIVMKNSGFYERKLLEARFGNNNTAASEARNKSISAADVSKPDISDDDFAEMLELGNEFSG